MSRSRSPHVHALKRETHARVTMARREGATTDEVLAGLMAAVTEIIRAEPSPDTQQSLVEQIVHGLPFMVFQAEMPERLQDDHANLLATTAQMMRVLVRLKDLGHQPPDLVYGAVIALVLFIVGTLGEEDQNQALAFVKRRLEDCPATVRSAMAMVQDQSLDAVLAAMRTRTHPGIQ